MASRPEAEASWMRPLVAMVAFVLALAGGVYAVAEATGMWDVPESRRPGDGPAVPAGWQVHHAAGVTIALPPTWAVLGPKERWDTKAFRRANPELAQFVGTSERGRSANNELMAFDTGALGKRVLRRDGFATNLGLIVSPVSLPRAAVWRADLAGLRGLPGRLGRIESRRVEVAGRPALHIRYTVAAEGAAGRTSISTAQWSVVIGGRQYVLNFATTPSAERRYADFVAQMLSTLAFPAPPPAPPARSFAARADRVCDSHHPSPGVKKLDEADRLRAIADVYVAQVKDLRRLEPPPALATRYAAMLRHGAAIPGELRRYADAVEAGSRQAAAKARGRAERSGKAASDLAEELGLTSCAG
jgi:hypothetical protein